MLQTFCISFKKAVAFFKYFYLVYTKSRFLRNVSNSFIQKATFV